MGERHSSEEEAGAQQRGSDDQCHRVAPVMLTLKDGGYGESRRERRESSAESSDDNLSSVSVNGARELVRDKPGDTAADCIGGDSGPWSIGGVVATNCVFAEIAHRAANSAE
jgi:hypothetical protein